MCTGSALVTRSVEEKGAPRFSAATTKMGQQQQVSFIESGQRPHNGWHRNSMNGQPIRNSTFTNQLEQSLNESPIQISLY
jgi:hypothetical protein